MSLLAKYKIHIVLVGVAVASAAYIFLTSRWGFGSSPDSIVYIAGARSLASGNGFSIPSVSGKPSPIVHFPPFFSLTLASFGAVGVDPLDAASLLNAVLFALNIYLAGLFAYRVSKRPAAGVIAAALTLTAPAILVTHTMVWSEGLFLFLVLVTAFATHRYADRPDYRSLLLILPSTLLAPLTRYVGIALVLAACVTVAMNNVRHAVVLTSAALLGIGAWLARNYLLAADLTNRSIVFHPPTGEQLTLAAQTVVEGFGGVFLAAVFGVLLVMTFLRRPSRSGALPQSDFLMYFAFAYLGVLTLTVFFADAQTPLDRRILSPLYLSLSIYTVIWMTSHTARPLRLAWATLSVLVVVSYASTSIAWLNLLANHGIGYSSSMWRASSTLEYLKKHEHAHAPVHTNAPDPILLLLGTPAAMIPRHVDPGSRAENPDYARQMLQVKKNGGTVVYFRTVTWRSYLPGEDRLRTELGLSLLADLGDGAVYAVHSR